jgi:tellurite resistance protein TerC
MTVPIWIAFILLIIGLVALDLGVFHRKDRVVTLRSALGWSSLWISMAMLFMVFVYFLYESNYPWSSLPTEHMDGRAAVTQFLTGYVLEYSLSLDNVFVIAMILAYFRVPAVLQHRVLFWGILGAVVLRGVMIALGVALINRFEWVTYIFGLFLLYSAARMLMLRHETVDPSENPLVKLAQRMIPVTNDFHGHHFVVRIDGKLMATPLLLALLLVESSDVMFAVDSIPAIFAITRDPFIIFTSNIFAILGLRSLYFILAAYMQKFRYLKQALVFVLAYVGVKMIVSHHYDIPDMASLSIIGGILLVGILASIRGASSDPVPLKSPLDE